MTLKTGKGYGKKLILNQFLELCISLHLYLYSNWLEEYLKWMQQLRNFAITTWKPLQLSPQEVDLFAHIAHQSLFFAHTYPFENILK